MAISRGLQPRQLYGLGSLVKSVTKGIKGAVKGVAKAAKSPLGLAAIASFVPFGGQTLLQRGMGFLGSKGLPSFTGVKDFFKGDATLGKTAAMFAGGSLLGGLASAVESGDEEAVAATRDVNALRSYLEKGYRNLNYSEDEIPALVENDVSEYTQDMARGQMANGGRIGYAGGTEFEEYLKGREEFNKKQNAEQLYKEYLENKRRQKVAVEKTMAANGGLMPTGVMRANKAGTIERDYRETGGFVPVGIKEKADDVPAMLSKNEFVMTADAVRGMGGGNIEKGAQRLYDQMKTMEKRVV